MTMRVALRIEGDGRSAKQALEDTRASLADLQKASTTLPAASGGAIRQVANDLAGNGAGSIAGAARLSSGAIQQLGFQLNDITTGLVSGQSPLQVLAQQGGQVYQVLSMQPDGVGGAVRGIGSQLAALLTPARVAMGAIGAIGVTAVAAYASWTAGQKEVAIALRGIGRAAGATVEDINVIADAGAAAGRISVAAAREAAIEFVRTGKIAKEQFVDLIVIAKKYAATVGTDFETAMKTVAEAFADPVNGAETLNKQLGFLDDRTQQYIKRLVEQNNRTAAQRALMVGMRGSLVDAEASTSALARSWAWVSRTASDAYGAVGRAIDRAAGTQAPSEKMQDLQNQAAAWRQVIEENKEYEEHLRKSGSSEKQIAAIIPALKQAREELARVNRELDEMRRKSDEVRAKADLGAIEANARELGQKAMAAARGIVPGFDTIRQLQTQLGELRKAFEDPLAAKGVESLDAIKSAIQRYEQALASLTGQNARFVDPQERKLRLQQIEIDLIKATTPAQRAALEAERARIELIGHAVTPEQAALNIAQARGRVYAEMSRTLRDYARDQQFSLQQTQLEISLVGRSEEEREKALGRLKAEQDLLRQQIPLEGAYAQSILARTQRQAEANLELARARDLMQGWQSVFDSSMGRFADLLAQGKLDWKNWGDAGKAAISDILRELIKLATINPLKNLLFGANAPTLSNSGGLLGGLFGLFGGGGSSGPLNLGNPGGTAGILSPIHHSGRGPGESAMAYRSVHPAWFERAPRYHSGRLPWGPGEQPAIIRDDESVLTPAQMRALGSRGETKVSVALNIDARGAQSGSGEEIVKVLRAWVKSDAFKAPVIEAVAEGRSRGHL